MVGRIEIMQRSRTPDTRDEENLTLWYEMGRLYAESGGGAQRATKLSFASVCATGALVLLSAPVFGTAWAGPFAAVIPVAAGLLSGGTLFLWQRSKLRRRTDVLSGRLAERGLDAERPARDGLGAYYDAQLILLRSEYEYLRGAGKSARLLEESFGFAPEDPFETGPLNVAPDTPEMEALRGRWEQRIYSRKQHGMEPPALGSHEELSCRAFPREMTVPAELSMRRAYLGISRRLILERYGANPGREPGLIPGALRQRVERDLREYEVLSRRL
jgi:hypothetical protein